MDWTRIGGVAGDRGRYTSPDGVTYHVIIMEMASGTGDRKAREWKCIGWSVALAYEGYAIAAGTGTVQRTFTPEQPPTIDQTPVPGTEDDAKTLLARSPLLTEKIVERQAITNPKC